MDAATRVSVGCAAVTLRCTCAVTIAGPPLRDCRHDTVASDPCRRHGKIGWRSNSTSFTCTVTVSGISTRSPASHPGFAGPSRPPPCQADRAAAVDRQIQPRRGSVRPAPACNPSSAAAATRFPLTPDHHPRTSAKPTTATRWPSGASVMAWFRELACLRTAPAQTCSARCQSPPPSFLQTSPRRDARTARMPVPAAATPRRVARATAVREAVPLARLFAESITGRPPRTGIAFLGSRFQQVIHDGPAIERPPIRKERREETHQKASRPWSTGIPSVRLRGSAVVVQVIASMPTTPSFAFVGGR